LTPGRIIGVLTLGLALAAPAAASAEFQTSTAGQRYVQGEAIVRYEPGVDAAERRDLRSDADVRFEASVALPRVQVVSFDGPVGSAIARLEDQPGVVAAQPNYRYHALAAAPNDSHFGNLWGLGPTPGVGVLPAWDRSRGAAQVIAVVDTGVDLTHPDLAGNLWTKPGQPGVHGHDFVDGDNVPDDFNLHGTHVAGTAAAIAGNGVGVAGVAPQAQIMAVRVLDGDGAGNSADIANGIVFAANEGAGVINLSFGGPAEAADQFMQSAIGQAEQKNVVVVAAAGNEGSNNDASPVTPCVFPNANLICVAAVTRGGARSDFSNFGATTVDLGAPGGDGNGDPAQDILSAKPAWATPVFSDDFDSGLGQWTATSTSGLDWGIDAGSGVGGSDAVTDSPNALYEPDTESMLKSTAAVDLTGRRGCRLDYLLNLVGVEDGFDFVGIGVTGPLDIGENFTGDGAEHVETSISRVDNQPNVRPTFFFVSDAVNEGDGAYVDDFNLLCRGNAYDDVIGADNAAAGHSYTAIAGTSMAAPHVAGVAALVRAVDQGAPPAQVVQALRNGARPLASMSGVTVSGGVVDAVGAMDAALALPNPQPPQPQPTKPRKPRFGTVKVSRKGVVSIVVKGDRSTTGVLTLTANVTAARVRNVGRKAFRIRSAGRATVKVKLKRPALRQLKRKRKLRVKAKAVTKNAAGLSSSATKTLRLKLPRRR
jgi:thermitase